MWAPSALWLITLRPGSGAVAAGAAGVLALLGARALGRLCALPQAPEGPGVHRVLPSRPALPMLQISLGLAAWGMGAWQAQTDGGVGLLSLASLPTGALLLGWAASARRDPLWGTAIHTHPAALRIQPGKGDGWSVQMTQIRRIYVRASDGSALLHWGDDEEDLFLPTKDAGARYFIEDHTTLMAQLTTWVPALPTRSLSAARRTRQRYD